MKFADKMRKMKKSISFFLVILVLIAFFPLLSSTEIFLQEQPKEVYNLNDAIKIPVKIDSGTDSVQGTLHMELLCDGSPKNFYENGVKLKAGRESSYKSTLLLSKEKVGSPGKCKIRASFGEINKLTEEFKVSDKININLDSMESNFNPGDNLTIKGESKKVNGDDVNGFIETSFSTEEKSFSFSDTVNNGFLSLDISFPEDIPAGDYSLPISVYEKNSDDKKTNKGKVTKKIHIRQIPTSLETVLNKSMIEPGKDIEAKAILYDQTGNEINSSAYITIKDEEGNIVKKSKKPTGEFLSHTIDFYEEPGEWNVEAVSNNVSGEASFEIVEKREIKSEFINNTLLVKNVGNVPYNDSISVEIGNHTENMIVSLDVEEAEKYVLTAPDGTYNVSVSSEGKNFTSGSMALTGNAVNIKKAGKGAMSLARKPLVWIFVILVFIAVGYLIFRKGYKKTIMGFIKKPKKSKHKNIVKEKSSKKDNNDDSGSKSQDSENKAELVLSLEGDKQSASMVCLRIKNYEDIKNSSESSGNNEKGSFSNTLQKITEFAEKNKALTYQADNNFFFIFAPIKTKTFRNEKTAYQVAEKIKSYLEEHNKYFNQKIDYGVSVNFGDIIAKHQKGEKFRFMAIGNLLPITKKIANASEGEVLLSEELKNKMSEEARTERIDKDDLVVYRVKELKNREEYSKFINEFIKRQNSSGSESSFSKNKKVSDYRN